LADFVSISINRLLEKKDQNQEEILSYI